MCAVVAVGCGTGGSTGESGPDASRGTGGSAVGGAPMGGAVAGGGATGGIPLGGTTTGGTTTGGTTTGGTAAGGTTTGGTTTGGASSGGAAAGSTGTGGTTTGGTAAGGTTTGGTGPSTGGADTGGASTAGAGTGGTASTGGAASGLDPFGIVELYPSAPSGARWTSEHWANGTAYAIDERTDPNDPLGLSGMRGTGTLDVTGDGELVMGGSQPRIYVYPGSEGPWRDVEVTVYYMRVDDDGTDWGGLVIGARSGPEGHGTEPCDAHTYYNRLRHDGAMDFEKELMHTPSSTQNRIEPAVLWPPDGLLPFDTWIGLKYVIYNLPPGEGIQLESYRDLTEGAGGGDWQLVSEYVENGGWYCQTTCVEHDPVDGESDLVWLDGGVTFIRNTGVIEARYKWFSVREIAP